MSVPDHDTLASRAPKQEAANQSIDAVMLAIWRRVVTESSGTDLTLAEAAALLGTSVEGVRKRIRSGELEAYRDSRSRWRIVPRISDASAEERRAVAESPETIGRLLEELKTAQRRVKELETEKAGLAHELENATTALDHSREEISAMWRVLSSRSGRNDPDDPSAGRRQSRDVARIQAQISAARRLAKRRRWPWATMVG